MLACINMGGTVSEERKYAEGGIVVHSDESSVPILFIPDGCEEVIPAGSVSIGPLTAINMAVDPPAPDLSADYVQDYISSEAEARAVDFLAKHSVKTCKVYQCGVCAELSVVKAEAIEVARNKLVDMAWRRFVDADIETDDRAELQVKMRAAMAELRVLPVSELW